MATDYIENKIGRHILMNEELIKPLSVYVAFFNTMPNDDGSGGDEVDGVDYERVSIPNFDSAWDEPLGGNGVFKNAYTIGWPNPPGAGWGTVLGAGLLDAATNGNLFFKALFPTSKVFTDLPLIKTGDLKITFSGFFSNHLIGRIGNYLFRSGTLDTYDQLYMSLFNVMPDAFDVGGTEVTGNGYQRRLVIASPQNWIPPVSGNGTFTNNENFDFPIPTSDWGNVVGWGMYDSLTSGNLIFFSALDVPKIINIGKVANFIPGELVLTID